MFIVIMLIIASVLYTLFNLFVAKAGGKLNDNLAAAIFNGLGAIIPFLIYVFVKNKNGTETTTSGLVYSILAGITIALVSVILVNIFARAENVSFVLPFVFGGTVVLGSIAGVFIFKESLSPMGIVGVTFVALGIGLLVYSKIHA